MSSWAATINSDASDAISIILFYKYHPLSSSRELMESYRQAMESLCASLQLKGRILIGCSENEGINGTLAGARENVRLFTFALLGEEYVNQHCNEDIDESRLELLQQFWKESRDFAATANVPPLTMDSPDDFKWSSTTQQDLFPDLNIKLVKEIIGTGGVLSQISLEETRQGYLTPKEWHDEMLSLDSSKTVLIDCRNTKEHAIGHFPHAIDPHTTTFNQFPQWVQENSGQLKDKRVLMYCTGGIRCEKASAYLRRQGVEEVHHLKGGIHKYLEEYGDAGTWRGKNFVFDGRGAASAQETQVGKDGGGATGNATSTDVDIVGQCLYCSSPYDSFHADCVCTVCREPVLVCSVCQEETTEYHCTDHFYLRSCYFTNLQRFSQEELSQQLTELERHLEEIAVGKRYKQRRKTLYKQCEKIRRHLEASGTNVSCSEASTLCRNCGESDCDGSCWGFHGLKRKQVLDKQHGNVGKINVPTQSSRAQRRSGGHRASKQQQRQRAVQEIHTLELSRAPSQHSRLGIRVPPPCTRVLQTLVKGKWCGLPVIDVLQKEFAELSRQEVFDEMLNAGLLRLNGEPLTKETSYTKLKNMDVISRILHWHEPPVKTQSIIRVEKVTLPQSVGGDGNCIYVCDKPSSVPVHPAGPYLANTLTMMVEAQERLEIRSLIPCHRIDRGTSGLTICCTDSKTAGIIQGKICEGVRKLYVARVKGRFPGSEEEASFTPSEAASFASWSWKENLSCVEVDAAIETMDAGNGIRVVSANGKPSRSRFQFLAYDSESDSSLIACAPLSGRGHQLRIHLQYLGFPIDGDVLYGGRLLDSDSSNVAVERMSESIADDSRNRAADGVSPDEVSRAKATCPCCKNGQEGIISSFTPAQLLKGGSEIYLHALRYELVISQRKRKTTESCHTPSSVLKLEVELPEWALKFEQVKIDWLQEANETTKHNNDCSSK